MPSCRVCTPGGEAEASAEGCTLRTQRRGGCGRDDMTSGRRVDVMGQVVWRGRCLLPSPKNWELLLLTSCHGGRREAAGKKTEKKSSRGTICNGSEPAREPKTRFFATFERQQLPTQRTARRETLGSWPAYYSRARAARSKKQKLNVHAEIKLNQREASRNKINISRGIIAHESRLSLSPSISLSPTRQPGR